MRRRLRTRLFGVPCREVIGLLTDYLEGALEPDTAAALDRHFARCGGCTAALEQFRLTIELSGALSEDDVEALPDDVRAEVMAAFRESRGG